MRILYYSPHPNLRLDVPSGSGTHMREVIRAFREAGHEVKVLVIGDIYTPAPAQARAAKTPPPQSRRRRLFEKIRDKVKPFIPSFIWRLAKDIALLRLDRQAEIRLEKLALQFMPDLIYERASYLQLSGSHVANKMKIPHYIEFNSPLHYEAYYFKSASRLTAPFAKKVEEKQLVRATKVICVSSVLKEYFLKQNPKLLEKDVLMLPNAVRVESVKPDKKEVAKIKETHRLHDKTVVGFVGFIYEYHGVDMLIQAFKEVKEIFPHAVLMIAGGGPDGKKYKKMSEELGLGDSVIFPGSIPHEQIFNYYECIDIAVMAKSNWYGSPVKIFEYGVMKKPIVAPDTPPIHDVMVDGKDGIVIPPEKEALVKAISTFMEREDLRLQMGENFHRKVIENHTWKRNIEVLLSTFKK